VFIGKSGAVRLRGGTFGVMVVVSSQELGCGRLQQPFPSVVVAGKKRAAEFEKRISVTRPAPNGPLLPFDPGEQEGFEIRFVASEAFDPKVMDDDSTARPSKWFDHLETERGDGLTLSTLDGVVFRAGKSAPDSFSVRHNKAGVAAFQVLHRDGAYRLRLMIDEQQLSVHGDLPLRKCPLLEHIHIEPRK
jgi:hypothetical protein